MKKLIAAVALAVAAFGLSGCGGNEVGGVNYNSYGLFNEDVVKDPNILYQVSPVSVIVPVYVVGWDLFEPISQKPATLTK